MIHTITIPVTFHILADDCTEAEHAAMDAVESIPHNDGIIEIGYSQNAALRCTGVRHEEILMVQISEVIPVLQTVTELLIARGIKATYEYPGSIDVIEPSGRYVVYGDVNETICGDVYRSLEAYESGDPEPEGISCDIPADCKDAERIADFIESQSKGVPQ